MVANFKLAWRTLWRGKAVLLLLAGVGLCHWLLPGFVRSDSSPEAERELAIMLAMSGSFALVAVAGAVMATALTSTEIAEKRFQLARVRKTGMIASMLGKWLALAALAGAALALSCAIVCIQVPGERSRIEWRPVAEDPLKLAEAGLDEYLANPLTPEPLKHMSRKRALSHLAMRLMENKTGIAPGKSIEWRFPSDAGAPRALSLRAANEFGLSLLFSAEVEVAGAQTAFTNTTTRLIEIPLPQVDAAKWSANPVVTFKNTGEHPLYCSFYRDVSILADGASWPASLTIAWLEMFAVCAAIAAIALFAGTAFSRSVAVFAVMAILAGGACAPAIAESHKDLAAVRNVSDRVALVLTRSLAATTSPIFTPSPVDDLAKRKCRPANETAQNVAMLLFAIAPAALLLASGVARKRAL